ncbi:hypothetical protein KC19_2G267300 [Ceratodon purpureus]|uniref:Uncharacterized protein n=1 Tax=Ceratodon purpureus TaxID=3225 RepID=A0A8T0IZU7_CERPU|nr:hypothetical protein KC19_2G267300 [Ceratodon purpureus]
MLPSLYPSPYFLAGVPLEYSNGSSRNRNTLDEITVTYNVWGTVARRVCEALKSIHSLLHNIMWDALELKLVLLVVDQERDSDESTSEGVGSGPRELTLLLFFFFFLGTNET